MGIKIKAGDRTASIPPGEYKAIIQTVALEKSPYKKSIFSFRFIIAEGEFHGQMLRGFCNADYESYTSHTKLWRWYERATARVPEGEFDIDEFQDRLLLVKVESKPSRKTKIIFSNVIEIIRLIQEL